MQPDIPKRALHALPPTPGEEETPTHQTRPAAAAQDKSSHLLALRRKVVLFYDRADAGAPGPSLEATNTATTGGAVTGRTSRRTPSFDREGFHTLGHDELVSTRSIKVLSDVSS